MKGKILIISLIAVFCVFLSACSCSNEEADPVKDPITHETDAGTTATPDVEDNGDQSENKDNGSSSGSSNSSSSKSNGSSSSKSNGGSTNSSSGKNNTTVTPAPIIETPEPEQTPTPPRRSSSSNLRVD